MRRSVAASQWMPPPAILAGPIVRMTLSVAPRRDEKVKVLRATRPIHKDEVVLGQYTAGNGMEGYLEDKVLFPS